jgi:hypothetical protein
MSALPRSTREDAVLDGAHDMNLTTALGIEEDSRKHVLSALAGNDRRDSDQHGKSLVSSSLSPRRSS